jgi:Major royal jelly protein
MLSRRSFLRTSVIGPATLAITPNLGVAAVPQAQLIRVAASSTFMLNGIAVAPNGRIFASCPRWTESPSPNVAEVMRDGTFSGYPNASWLDWQPGKSTDDRFVSVHSLHADADNQLWVVDDAVARQAPEVKARPKLVQIDLTTNAVVRTFIFDETVAPVGANLGHVRVQGQYAYLSDSRGALLVLDRTTERTRRLLAGNAAVLADTTIQPVIDGKPFRQRSGAPIEVGIDLLEISGPYLYFTCLFGPALWRIPLSALQNESLAAPELASQLQRVINIPPCAGLMVDSEGTFYLSAFTQNAILRWRNGGRLEIIASDARISFPNEGTVGPDGFLYFPASQIQRIPANQADGVSRVQLPFELFKIDVRPR